MYNAAADVLPDRIEQLLGKVSADKGGRQVDDKDALAGCRNERVDNLQMCLRWVEKSPHCQG